MNDITPGAAPTPAETLHAELRPLIGSSRQRLAGAVNAELTRLYWSVGKRLHTEVLGDARASYGTQLLDKLGQQLTQEFGRGFESRNLRRMVKFAESFPDAAIVSTLSTQLSWSHMVAIVALKNPQARQFYASQARKPHRPHPVRRIQPRTGGAAANAQRRHHRSRILDRAAAQGRAGAALAPSPAGSA